MMSHTVTALRSTLRAAAEDDSIQPLVLIRRRMQLAPGLLATDLDAFEAALRRAADLPAVEALDECERALAL